MTTVLSVSSLEKRYDALPVLDNINFTIQKGEFVTFLGPNGCGKTTLLHILSGLDEQYTGVVRFLHPQTKKGFIFQNPDDSLLPWKTVEENLLLDSSVISTQAIDDVLRVCNLSAFKKKYPYQLSGGMKQILALARAFLFNCNVLFLDEPFSSLDYRMSSIARNTLLQLWQKKTLTIFFVSHDIEEAILLSDKIILLSEKPTGIKKIVPIRIPRPRNAKRFSKKFFAYKKMILAELQR